MNKKSIRVAALFSVTVFFILTATMLLIGGIFLILFHFGVISQMRNPLLPFAFLSTVSVVVGTSMARFGGRRMLAPIVAISEASKEVARGNFDIRLDVDARAEEVRTMAVNFMRMTQELANTETFRSDFISNVSHEFKTPLAAIEGYATLLQATLPQTAQSQTNLTQTSGPQTSPSEQEKQAAYIEKILVNTRRLTTLCGNILQLARLENQEIAPSMVPFSLDEQLREALLFYEEEWTNKQIRLDIDLAPVTYRGNAELLLLVWTNLIGNAVKYVDTGGHIRIRLAKENGMITGKISDDGIGMTEEVQRHVFDKFYQGDTSHSAAGNGLGLTLARRIVDLHGGSVTLSSAPGEGSTFLVRLPVSSG